MSHIKHVRETKPAVHRKIKMKTIRRKELTGMKISNPSSRSHYDSEIAPLYEEIRTVIVDAEIFYRLYPTDEGTYSIDGAVIGLFRNGIEFHIAVRTHPKKCYTIYPELSGLEHIDRYTIERISSGLEPPKKIGVLTRKKVEAWIDYHTHVYLRLKKENERKRLEIETFRQTVGNDPDLKWEHKNKGSIRRNGLLYSFEIRPTIITEHIDLCITLKGSKYEIFRCLADNRYEQK